jgi:signal transduction histidine kinase/uncharacterized protein YigA (DUF484 family)
VTDSNNVALQARGEYTARLIESVRSVVIAEGMDELLESFLRHATELSNASSGLLILMQDLLLAEKRLAWLDLTERKAVRKGGYVFGTILTERAPKMSQELQHIRRRVLAETALKGCTTAIPDLCKDPSFKDFSNLEPPPVRSVFCVPIRKTEEIGLLYLEHTEPGHFSGSLVGDLTLLAEIAAVGLHNKLNEGLDFMLSRAASRLISAESRMERQRLIEMVLNEFKLRLGFGQVIFLRLYEDRGSAEIERAILDQAEGGDNVPLRETRFQLVPPDDLIETLIKEKKIASVEGIQKKTETALSCHINGKPATIANAGLVSLLGRMNYNPFLAIPLYLPNGVSGILIADKHGLPIILGNAVRNFLVSLSSSLSLALNWADEYQDMKRRLARMYEERLRRESLTEVGSIIGEVSHVIASPIKHLITTLDRLARKDFLQEEIRSNVRKMAEWSSKIKSYLFYVQDLAKTEELEPVLAPNDLVGCIRSAWAERVAPFYPNIELDIKESAGSPLEPFPFDSLQITSLFANLFMNAARAMEERGTVIKVGTWVEDDMVKVSIEDSGSGIPEEILCDFFNIDRRIDYMSPEKGRGRGTLICKEIIKRHKGSIEIFSTGGRFVTSYSEKEGHKRAYFDAAARRKQGTMVVVSLPYRTVPADGCEVN